MLLKLVLRDGAEETWHLPPEVAIWLAENLAKPFRDGRYADRRRRTDDPRPEDPDAQRFLELQPSFTEEDWDNRRGRRTVVGTRCNEFADAVAIRFEIHQGDPRDFVFPDQTLLYLVDYLEPLVKRLSSGRTTPRISIEDINQASKEYLAYMETLDQRLRREKVPIPERPRVAFSRLRSHGLDLTGDASSEQLAAKQVSQWFLERYGERLEVDFTLGESLVIVRGDPYRLKLPLIIGPFDGVFYIPHIVDGMTVALFRDLTDDERDRLINTFASTYEHLRYIDLLPRRLTANLRTAVERALDKEPHLGESKWASLQFLEKTIKANLESKGAKPERTHDLEKLAQDLEVAGGPVLPGYLLKNVQCPAGVRLWPAASHS